MTFDEQTRLSLIHGILSEPGEEAPRLVYADWLEERGDPLGELVRLHLEMGRPWATRSRLRSMRRHEREILDRLGFAGSERAGGWWFTVADCVPRLHVGFGEAGMALPPAEWIERFGWFTAQLCEYDEHYGEFATGDMLRRFFDWPGAERCVGLDMADVCMGEDCGEALAAWPGAAQLLRVSGFDQRGLPAPALRGLVDLELPDPLSLDEGVAEALAAMPGLRRLRLRTSVPAPSARTLALLSGLRSLDLSYNWCEDAVAHALAEGALRDLAELNLRGSRVSDAGVLALIRSPNLPGLRRLNLRDSGAGLAAVEAMCASDRFLRCGELDLCGCPVYGDAVAAVALSPHAARLRSLRLPGNRTLNDGDAITLANSPHLGGLVELSIDHGEIGPAGAEALAASLPWLEELALVGNPIGDRGALALARFAQARGGALLNLTLTGLTADGVLALIASGRLAGLEELDISNNPVGDAAVAALARCPGLAGLCELGLREVGLTDVGARALVESPHLSERLRLHSYSSHGSIGPDATEALRQRFRG